MNADRLSREAQKLAATAPYTDKSVSGFALAPDSLDSADIVNLWPGAYTMQVSGMNNTTRVALAEVYEVQ